MAHNVKYYIYIGQEHNENFYNLILWMSHVLQLYSQLENISNFVNFFLLLSILITNTL